VAVINPTRAFALRQASALRHASALLFAIALTAVALPSQLAAQRKPPAGATKPAGPAGAVGEPKLVFDREVFSYPGAGRRDPFKPLIGKESLGPLFDDLKLRGIIYSPDPTRSIVLIQDGAKRIYRLKRGDVVGNSRIVEIKPLAARFAVENFGMIRYEVLQLRAGEAAAGGMQSGGAPVPATAPMPQGAAPTSPSAARLDSMMAKPRD
jgi:hypothetical protein